MLGEVGFDALDAGLLQRMWQTDLLAQHRFGARHPLGTCGMADVDDDAAGFF
jgi:hypothetical protein